MGPDKVPQWYQWIMWARRWETREKICFVIHRKTFNLESNLLMSKFFCYFSTLLLQCTEYPKLCDQLYYVNRQAAHVVWIFQKIRKKMCKSGTEKVSSGETEWHGCMFVCGELGQRGEKRGGKRKQIHNASSTSKKCENLYKPISSNNRQGWIDEKQRRRRERQNRATEWTGLPHSLLNFLLHSPLHTVNYWPGIPLPPFHT